MEVTVVLFNGEVWGVYTDRSIVIATIQRIAARIAHCVVEINGDTVTVRVPSGQDVFKLSEHRIKGS